jgi:predicted aspartyl protease
MILPYLTNGFDTPTPAVKVQLFNPTTKAKEVGIARIDYGADITTIPFTMLENLNLNVFGTTYTSGYNDPGEEHLLFICSLRLRSLKFNNIKVIAALTPHILLGLDILNTLHICLDGNKNSLKLSMGGRENDDSTTGRNPDDHQARRRHATRVRAEPFVQRDDDRVVQGREAR